MKTTIGFRPNEADREILARAHEEGLTDTEAIRKALALLDRDLWWRGARSDMERLAGEDLTTEPDSW